jgi:hypothetical protein
LLALAALGLLAAEATDGSPGEAPATNRYASAAAAESDPDPNLPGEFIDLQRIYGGVYGSPEGPTTAPHMHEDLDYESHCSPDEPVVCNTNPPAGGPHWSGACGTDDPSEAAAFCGPASWGIYREPWETETLVHNMEHSGVIIWYDVADPELIAELEGLANERVTEGSRLILAPYPEMEDGTIAITSWSRIDRFQVSGYSPERIVQFIDAHHCRFDPEELC